MYKVARLNKERGQHSTGSGNHHAGLHANKLALIMLLLCYPAETAPSRTVLVPYACCKDAGTRGITQLHLPVAAPGTVVPLIAAETTMVPGQRLMRVMPRSWQFKPLYGFSFFLFLLLSFLTRNRNSCNSPTFEKSMQKAGDKLMFYSSVRFSSPVPIYQNMILVCEPNFFRYGDRCPRGVPARLFAITWTLCGLVVIAILTGKIATVLTDFGYAGPYISLYGTKVSQVKDAHLVR